MKTILLLLAFFFIFKMHSQTEVEAGRNFNKIKDVITSVNDFNKLKNKLDSIKLTFKDQKNNYVESFFNQSIDFGYTHNRINVKFDMWDYQIDLVTKKDSIYLKSLKTEYFKKYTYNSLNEEGLKDYLKKRKLFYQRDKNSKELLKEISLNETFATHCGDGMQITKQGLKLERIVSNEDIGNLKRMLASFNCEQQAFAVLGFEILSKNGIYFPTEYKKIIDYINARNSELQICAGCFTGLVEKIY